MKKYFLLLLLQPIALVHAMQDRYSFSLQFCTPDVCESISVPGNNIDKISARFNRQEPTQIKPEDRCQVSWRLGRLSSPNNYERVAGGQSPLSLGGPTKDQSAVINEMAAMHNALTAFFREHNPH